MATQKSKKYNYTACKHFKTTTHYILDKSKGNPLISDKLNISESRNFAKSKPLFWCQERVNGKWVKPRLTGLFKTNKDNVFWGCRGRFEHLIIFVFENSRENLTVYYFENYFTRNLTPIINSI